MLRTCPPITLTQLYYSFLYRYFSSGISIWGKANSSILCPLVRIQKTATRLIHSQKARAHTKQLFIKSKILPVSYIYQLSVLSLMFKVYHEMLPSVIQDLFIKRHKISKYTTRQINTFLIPKTLTQRSIMFQGPSEFNKIIIDPNTTLQSQFIHLKNTWKTFSWKNLIILRHKTTSETFVEVW